MNKKNLSIVIVIVIVIIGLGVWWFIGANQPGELDSFAKCLQEKETVFYGAFWCPHCQSQKAAFKNSAKYLPYVECSTPDSRGQLEACSQKGIQAYPTWEFQDGSREQGELSLDELAEKSGCQLP